MHKFSRVPIFPLTFNGYPARLMLKITKTAHKNLWEKLPLEPIGSFPIPFINKSDVGSHANFKCKRMANEVTQLVDQIKTKDFPDFCNMRLVLNLFYHCIDAEDEEIFICHVEDKTIFLLHPEEGMAEETISKMTQTLQKYMIQHPVVLISELLSSCTVKLTEDEMLMIPCGMQTFFIPIHSKETQFMSAFLKTLNRLIKQKVDCQGMDFYDVKDKCKEIDIKGVYFYITPENVELTGLPFNVKNFSDILKRRLKEQHSETRVLSRK